MLLSLGFLFLNYTKGLNIILGNFIRIEIFERRSTCPKFWRPKKLRSIWSCMRLRFVSMRPRVKFRQLELAGFGDSTKKPLINGSAKARKSECKCFELKSWPDPGGRDDCNIVRWNFKACGAEDINLSNKRLWAFFIANTYKRYPSNPFGCRPKEWYILKLIYKKMLDKYNNIYIIMYNIFEKV